MRLKKLMILAICLPLSGMFYGCATSENKSSSSGMEKEVSSSNDSKAEKKISMAIGQEIGDFSITNRQEIEAPTGYDGTQYAVKTNDGRTFKCEILEPSGLGKAMTWGMASGADAMCTEFTKGSKDAGKTNKASCNDLLRAAGKC